MAKKDAAATSAKVAKAEKAEKAEGQGRAVTLPNGVRRIDYIRDAYYDKKTGTHTDACKTRSEIKNDINEMLVKAGNTDEQIPYQIVFAACKTGDDPRVAAAAAAKVKAAEAATKAKEEAAKAPAAGKAK